MRTLVGENVEYTDVSSSVAANMPMVAKCDRFAEVPGGSALIVTDFPENIDRILSLMDKVETTHQAAEAARPSTVSENVVLRSLDLNAARAAVHGLPVEVSAGSDGSEALISGPRPEVLEAVEQLRALERRAPQGTLHMWLLGGPGDGKSGSQTLPGALVEGLNAVYPAQNWTSYNQSVVRTELSKGSRVYTHSGDAVSLPDQSLLTEVELQVEIAGFDSKTGTLDLQSFELTSTNQQQIQRLTTSMSLTSGEYVVVGSLQGGKLLAVVYFEAQ
ncbi:MAG: hypothetical protein R3E96_11470 [Planctomycetota bacterium]